MNQNDTFNLPIPFIEALRRVASRPKSSNKSRLVFSWCAPYLANEDDDFKEWFEAYRITKKLEAKSKKERIKK